ncbi:MAG: type IV pilus twitching motility protein PilT [Firmicutes bacterium]|nr:type IV pilus twitching motility protein PilT [Bacillota bacterium]
MDIFDLLREAVGRQASDLHLSAEMPPMLRLDGQLLAQGDEALTAATTRQMLASLLPDPAQQDHFERQGELDFAYGVSGLGRFRINAYKQRGSVALAIRLIPHEVPALEELRLPQVVADLVSRRHGLVLVTGPTGSGKSTTLAAMIDHVNRSRHCHIVTLEDPIEYLHKHKSSIVNQREVGIDTGSFAQALRAVLRQDPDVILVGEMRDLETISIAITAAETGHLVLGTLHAAGATEAVDRLVDVFPPHQQEQIRVQLAATLQGILAQQLLPRRQGGRVAAVEVLVATPGVRNLIREGKTHQLPSLLQTGAKHGMRTMESALRELADARLIDPAELERWRYESGL